MKIRNYLLLAFAFIGILGSCSKENVVVEEPEPAVKVQLTASFESKSFGASMTDNSLVWTQNDKIAVLGENVVAPFTLSDGAETGTASFTGYMPNGAKGVVFPYIEENPVSISGEKLTMTLPNTITDITKCNLPMWSSLNGSTVTLKHLVGLLAISVSDIPEGCTQLVLETSNTVSGAFTADLSSEAVTLVPASNNIADENKKITVTFNESVDDDNDRLFYIPLPVGSYSSIKVSLVVGGAMETLEEWNNKVIDRAKIYSASLTYTTVDGGTSSSITSALDDQFKAEGGEGTVAPEASVQIDLTSEVTATADPIVIPTAAESSSSDITMNFFEAPVTTTELPLVLEQNKDAEIGESVNELTLNMQSDAEIVNMSINAPTTTVSLNGGNYKALKARTGLNTLIVGSDVVIDELKIEGGNIRIQSGGKITGSIINESGDKVTIILESGATIENSLPADFEAGEEFLVVNTAELALRQAIAQGGDVVLSENIELYNSLEISNAVTINLNGKSLKGNYSDVFVVLKDGELTLNDADNTGIVWGSVNNSSSSCAVWAKGGNVTINGGIYKVGDNNGADEKYNKCIHAGNLKIGEEYLLGNITINGGVFEYTGTEATGANYLLSPANFDSKIVVKGGKYKNFNPAENSIRNFVHSDYKAKLVEGTTDMYEVVLNGFVLNESGEYEIKNTDGLFDFAAMVEAGETFAGKTIKLTADLDLEDRPWTPIGAARSSADNTDVIFQGNFDGQNHAIKNMEVFTNEYRFIGLFATTHGATIQNVTLEGGEVKAADCSFNTIYAGAVVGYARGTYIINCHNKDCAITVTRTDDQRGGWIGGIVGGHTYWEDIKPVCIACTNTATITSPYIPSGVAGGSFGGRASYVACVNTGDIVVTGTYQEGVNVFASGMVGEMAGENYMYSCFSDCSIPDSSYNHGALSGDAGTNYANIHYSYSTVTNVSLLGQCWGTPNETIGVVSSYNEAVDNLNAGIELYNQTATVPCNYRFVAGDKPTLQKQ